MQTISIIVPFYNEEKNVDSFTNALFLIIDSIKTYLFEVIYINDGSDDSTLKLLKQQVDKHSNIRIISFSRNFGHEAAINAGIDSCTGAAAIVMDADLQDQPECIPLLIKKYEEGYDVVNVKHTNRRNGDTFVKRTTARIFYRLIAHWSYKVKIVENVNNFRLISNKIINIVKSLSSKNRVFRFEVPFAGFKTTNIDVPRSKRIYGKSHYNLSNMSRLAIDSIVSVSIQPLNLITKIFLAFLALFFASSITELTLFLVQTISKVIFIDGIYYLAWLIINISFFFMLIVLFAAAIIAQYVARIHLESQNRPTYIIDEIITNKKNGKK